MRRCWPPTTGGPGSRCVTDTRRWQEGVEAYVRRRRLDAVVETALADADTFRAAAAAYRAAGHRIEVAVLAVPEAVSQLSVLERYLGQVEAAGAGRYVSFGNHDLCSRALLGTLRVIEAEDLADRIPVFRRDREVLASTELNGAIRGGEGAAAAVAAERLRPWTARETQRFRQAMSGAQQRVHPERISRERLAWHFDTSVLKAESAVDGWYPLLTSVPADQADAGQALIHYKGQGTVERRYHDFKGPLAVAPVFVQHNRRVAALIQVICLVLLVFCLIERQVRRALGPEQTMSGLYPDNRRVRPTGRMIFYHFGELTLQVGNITEPPTAQITRSVQLHLLDLLDTDIGQTRWPQT
ncbi:zeta toxin family protein [Streptomyces sp. NPDC052496]|uniref:zeta toxin family protein n=1 Tax=Streptomyces sp. NPDC052496 TaxID=3154951 RepID=UPI0034408845